MQTSTAVTDQALADNHRIAHARSRVILVAPGLAEVVPNAITTLTGAQPAPQITLILDPDEDAYRVGYGDPKGAALLAEQAPAHPGRPCRVGSRRVQQSPGRVLAGWRSA